MAQRQCEDCGNVFDYEPNPNFPDKRKYCDSCSLERKAKWNAKQGQTKITAQPKAINQAPKVDVKTIIDMVHGVILNKTEKPHSYEFGKAGARHKIYYSKVQELLDHIQELTAVGLIDASDIPKIPAQEQEFDEM